MTSMFVLIHFKPHQGRQIRILWAPPRPEVSNQSNWLTPCTEPTELNKYTPDCAVLLDDLHIMSLDIWQRRSLKSTVPSPVAAHSDSEQIRVDFVWLRRNQVQCDHRGGVDYGGGGRISRGLPRWMSTWSEITMIDGVYFPPRGKLGQRQHLNNSWSAGQKLGRTLDTFWTWYIIWTKSGWPTLHEHLLRVINAPPCTSLAAWCSYRTGSAGRSGKKTKTMKLWNERENRDIPKVGQWVGVGLWETLKKWRNQANGCPPAVIHLSRIVRNTANGPLL